MGRDHLAMNAREQGAAGMKGRGASTKQIADTFGVSLRTVERWGECYPDGRDRVPGFRAEVERVRAQSANPTAEGTLLDALSARKDDGVNWQARIAAAVNSAGARTGSQPPPLRPTST
jgi:Homeodomain-like domain